MADAHLQIRRCELMPPPQRLKNYMVIAGGQAYKSAGSTALSISSYGVTSDTDLALKYTTTRKAKGCPDINLEVRKLTEFQIPRYLCFHLGPNSLELQHGTQSPTDERSGRPGRAQHRTGRPRSDFTAHCQGPAARHAR